MKAGLLMTLLLCFALAIVEFVMSSIEAIKEFGKPNKRTWNLILGLSIESGIFVLFLLLASRYVIMDMWPNHVTLFITLAYVLWALIFKQLWLKLMTDTKEYPEPTTKKERKAQLLREMTTITSKAEIKRKLEKINNEK